ncbi:hypothetical protein CC86DRAFT_447621 [Ophiobolus disseminans]|uniref:MARVEL domain-containing protein n=1 Tax=Ophiobolus disseminans TaxID=1469910 RepID=A0A6A6ZTX6_9PLEO|nr:hypothetical protein CC86DRAFT_447621 [Ophiobolus disseminans]
MRIPQSYIQKCKVVGHLFQGIFIFVGLCITITVFSKKGETGGATKFYLALCFLSLPAIIYLSMVPMWSRAARFANAYAFLAIDVLYTILWFAAFIAVAMWNSSGIKEGAKDKKIPDDERNCTTFKWGSESKCNVSKASVGVGVVIFLLFALTTAVSGYYLHKFLREGVLPYESKTPNPHHITGDSSAAKDNAWSTEIETAHRDSDDDDRRTEHGGNQQEDEYALLHSTETDEGRHPGRPLSWGEERGAYGQPKPYADYREPAGVNALSPGGYDDYRQQAGAGLGGGAGSVNSKASHGGSGYSFGGGGR